jgi:hypothetical protein
MFGALRTAHHVLVQLSRIVKADLAWIERALLKSDDVKGQSAPPPVIDVEYLKKLRFALDDRIKSEREDMRDRDELARIFSLPVMEIVQGLNAGAFDENARLSAVDRLHPSGVKRLYGKTVIDVRLKLDAINSIVDEVERNAVAAAQKRMRIIEKALDRIRPGRLQEVCGGALFAETRNSIASSRSDPSLQQNIAMPMRSFTFKFERLGALNRFLRARMEIAGFLMVIFLGISIWPVESGATGQVRKYVVMLSLGLAVLLALFSYLTTPALEEDRREEELVKLRELAQKISVDAAGRRLSSIMSDAVVELEALRAEIDNSVETCERQKVARPNAIIGGKARLGTLKNEVARELGGSNGVSALRAQIRSGLAPDSRLRQRVLELLNKEAP